VSPSSEQIDQLYEKLKKEAEENGYFLNPDVEFSKALAESLIVNTKRYGYAACPCRLVRGTKEDNTDIICPCDYRDDDLDEFGTCFCALYVSKDIAQGKAQAQSIPDRRATAKTKTEQSSTALSGNLAYPVWRCKVCGYLCARDNPPGVCPICKATKERFERFI
jgi:ferredoxin-thioredoxin reductase catalytic subunit